mgnify:FL=1
MFDTKVAIIVRNDLATWQRLNVVAFLSTGLASAAPEMLGAPYVDATGHPYASMSVQPILVFEGDLAGLQGVHRTARERELTVVPFIQAMFATGHDEANREVFRAEDAANMNLVGIAVRGPKKAVDKTVKGLALHP